MMLWKLFLVMEGVRGGSGGRVTRPALDVRWKRPLYEECCGGADGLHVGVLISQRERGGCGHWVLCPHKVHVDRAHHALPKKRPSDQPTSDS